jgi:TolA-binding protein
MARARKIGSLVYPLLLLGMIACAYYNTLFNAIKLYDSGTEKITASKDNQITAEIRKDFYDAIDKCWKLINLYSDSSKYADDAFLLIAKSHYQVEEYSSAERYLSQFLNRYPKSNLIPEATLWLAKSLIKLDKPDDASEYLNSIISENRHRSITAQAYYYLAGIFFQQKNYEPALNNLRQCIKASSDDVLSSSAQLTIGDIYFEQKEYKQAIENYDVVSKFSAPPKIDYDAQSKKVSTIILTGDYARAIEVLNGLLTQSRFSDYYAYFEAKLGECLTREKKYTLAAEKFNSVLVKYPRTEGSGIAAFRLAQLQELYYTDPDSARRLYLRVEREDKNSIYKSEAAQRAQLLQEYLKIKDDIHKDLTELITANPADTSHTPAPGDSVETVVDTLTVKPPSQPGTFDKKPEIPRPQRSFMQIKNSLDKNRFALAEFFLLSMQYYDSARVAYSDFISSTTDSSLIAKAYYSLYYIAADIKEDTAAARTYKNIILTQFPSSVYADYIRSKSQTQKPVKVELVDSTKIHYLQAESLLFNDRYDEAIIRFRRIAEQDSGTHWAEKARYAIAWIYEQKIGDIPKAIKAYSKIVQEYPNSAVAQIARNKIKIPVETEENKNENPADSSSVQQQSKTAAPPADSSQTVPTISPPKE